MPKATILQPHDDDAIIGMGGTLLKLLNSGWKIQYIYMTDGRHGGNISPEEIKRIRDEEAEAERNFLGIKSFHNFDIEDGKLEESFRLNKKDLVEKTAQLIKGNNIVFLPSKGEHHPDHRATYEIGHEAIVLLEANPLEVHYPIWAFPLFPYNPGGFEKVLKINLADGQFDKKLQALRLHKCQIEWGRYDKIIGHTNKLWSLMYSAYKKLDWNYCEVLGIPKINENYDAFANAVKPFDDVTEIYHGRKEEKIKA